MRGLDTNVLVRYLAADDPRQTRLVEKEFEASRENEELFFLSILVLCELVWVLERSFRQTKAEIVNVLEMVLDSDQFEIENDPIVRRCVGLYRVGKGHFADYLIGEVAREHGCRDTLTLDRDLKNLAGFTLLS